MTLNSSTLTGIAAILFGCGLAALLTALFRAADPHGGPWVWIGFALLAAAVACWFTAARAHRAQG